MAGYCSNSPRRCALARSMAKIVQTDGICPECGCALIPIPEPINSSHMERRVLMLGLSVTGLLLLLLAYMHYTYVA
ncbi:hypothetical protein [Psychrobacter aestuarii]|uniref:DUF2116 family Zn-ribbon domain-containing protein n=1 Tax=Psychrobacter aestuarii TaxID=556327 RepID=A0ABN0VYA0_9GAMM|nr:hypothetical protein [Psychrobacter aestuarii]